MRVKRPPNQGKAGARTPDTRRKGGEVRLEKLDFGHTHAFHRSAGEEEKEEGDAGSAEEKRGGGVVKRRRKSRWRWAQLLELWPPHFFSFQQSTWSPTGEGNKDLSHCTDYGGMGSFLNLENQVFKLPTNKGSSRFIDADEFS